MGWRNLGVDGVCMVICRGRNAHTTGMGMCVLVMGLISLAAVHAVL